MAKWRTLQEYTPFARTLVEYMWEQRPPLLPNQFAERMDVRKQALSTWLNSDAVPAPAVVVGLARGMGRPVRELMTAAGYAPAHDPLLDVADAWAYVRSAVERALSAAELGGTGELASAPAAEYGQALLQLLQVVAARTLGAGPGDGALAHHDADALAAAQG
jgi:hypothetical protein